MVAEESPYEERDGADGVVGIVGPDERNLDAVVGAGSVAEVTPVLVMAPWVDIATVADPESPMRVPTMTTTGRSQIALRTENTVDIRAPHPRLTMKIL